MPRRGRAARLEQRGHDVLHAFERVGNGARLLEDFLLHVVAVGAQIGRAACGLHGLHGSPDGLAAALQHLVAAQTQLGHIAVFQVDDLVGHARQGHGVAGQVAGAGIAACAQPQHQGRAYARAHQALRLAAVQHGNGVAAAQALHGGLHGGQQVARVQAVDQVDDGFGVRLAGKAVARGLQPGAQLLVVFDDAVVHQGDAALAILRPHLCAVRPHAEVRVRVVHRGRAMRGPAGVGNAGVALQALGLALAGQVGHAGNAAHAAQAACRIRRRGLHGHAAGVVATVFQPLQALHQHGNDVARGNRADDAAHISKKPSKPRQRPARAAPGQAAHTTIGAAPAARCLRQSPLPKT